MAEEKPLRELIGAWCSAYSDLNPKQMAALETSGVEAVDGFGDRRLVQRSYPADFSSGFGKEAFYGHSQT